MALKFKLKSKDEDPAELVNLYVERDGAWLLDVDGAVDKAKLEEFRATNVALMKVRDELRQRFEGIDPEEVRKLAPAVADIIIPSQFERYAIGRTAELSAFGLATFRHRRVACHSGLWAGVASRMP